MFNEDMKRMGDLMCSSYSCCRLNNWMYVEDWFFKTQSHIDNYFIPTNSCQDTSQSNCNA